MAKLVLGNLFAGNVGELAFERLAYNHGIAYLGLEEVHKDLCENQLTFKCGCYRIPLEIEKELIPEIKRISTPGGKHNSMFIFDYLAASLAGFKRGKGGVYLPGRPRGLSDLNLVEVKFGGGRLSEQQKEAMAKTPISVSVIRVKLPRGKLLGAVDIGPDERYSKTEYFANRKTLFDCLSS